MTYLYPVLFFLAVVRDSQALANSSPDYKIVGGQERNCTANSLNITSDTARITNVAMQWGKWGLLTKGHANSIASQNDCNDQYYQTIKRRRHTRSISGLLKSFAQLFSKPFSVPASKVITVALPRARSMPLVLPRTRTTRVTGSLSSPSNPPRSLPKSASSSPKSDRPPPTDFPTLSRGHSSPKPMTFLSHIILLVGLLSLMYDFV